MAVCEHCWERAATRARITNQSQTECYDEILAEQEAAGDAATCPEMQKGNAAMRMAREWLEARG